MAKSAIALKYKDQIIPESVVKALIEANHSCMGAVCTIDKADLQVQSIVEPPKLEDVMAVQESLKGYGVLFTFAQVDGTPQANEVQPHTVLWDTNNNPILAVALDGDFTEFANEKHSGEFNVAHDTLIPKLKQLYTLTGGDLEKVLDAMKEDFFQKDLLRLGKGDDTNLTFVSVNGVFMSMLHDPKAHREMASWGWHTKRWMQEAKKVVEKSEETKAAPTSAVASKPRLQLGGGSKTASAEPEKKPEASPQIVPESRPEVPVEGDDLVTITVPSHLSNSEKRAWWAKHVGQSPKDWKTGSMTIDRSKIRDFKLLGAANVKTVAAKQKPAEVDNAATLIPILSADMKTKIKSSFVSAHDNSSTSVGDPKKIAEREASAPSFEEQTGIPLAHAALWSYETYVKLGKEVSVESLAVLAMNLRNAYLDVATGTSPKKEETAPTASKPRLQLGAQKVA